MPRVQDDGYSRFQKNTEETIQKTGQPPLSAYIGRHVHLRGPGDGPWRGLRESPDGRAFA